MTETPYQSHPRIESSADHWALDYALRAHWPGFKSLRSRWETFKPDPYEVVRARLEAAFNTMQASHLMREFFEEQVKLAAEPQMQRMQACAEPILSTYVTTVLLSHALSEALINEVLAKSLATRRQHEIFVFVERATFLEKWTAGPRIWNETYIFPKAGAIYESLRFLNEERNAFTHHKVALTVDGEQVSARKVKAQSIPRLIDWTARFFSLPYDLADLLWRVERNPSAMRLLECKPIRRSALHARDLPPM